MSMTILRFPVTKLPFIDRQVYSSMLSAYVAAKQANYKRGSHVARALIEVVKALDDLEEAMKMDKPPVILDQKDALARVPHERGYNPIYFTWAFLEQDGSKVKLLTRPMSDEDSAASMMSPSLH
jgi:hypothetical protein